LSTFDWVFLELELSAQEFASMEGDLKDETAHSSGPT
jgi:hypothetical protein